MVMVINFLDLVDCKVNVNKKEVENKTPLQNVMETDLPCNFSCPSYVFPRVCYESRYPFGDVVIAK